MERLQKTYTKQLFMMLPKELHKVLKKSLLSKFDAEPFYDEILASL